MDLKKLTNELSVSPQIAAADLAAVKAAGFRSVVCHRPDGEGADQPLFREIAEAAEAQGLVIRHQPIVSGKLADTDAAAFDALLRELPKPVLAFCRTGTRSASLWSLTVERGMTVLAEFGYGGEMMPSLSTYLLNGKTPTRTAC